MTRFGRRVTLATLSLAVVVSSFASGRTSVATGISDPPPYATQAIPVADGPVVADADPFTMSAPGLTPGQIEMTTVSARPSLVTGDRARVEIRGLLADDSLSVTRNGDDVSNVFASRTPSVRQGVIAGLALGENAIVATVTGSAGTRSATLVVTNHSIAGPIISGAHQEPFRCRTEDSGMGVATDADCFAPTVFRWYARSAITGQFSLLDDPYGAYPPDTAVTLVGGAPVPFVVRVESAVINRSITRVAVLDDPHARGPAGAFTPEKWNRKLLYAFGESCGRGYDQGLVHETDVLGDQQAGINAAQENYAVSALADLPGHLGSGYVVALSSLTTLGVHCNPLLSAETLMMVKEHIVDDYGVVAHTIGLGGSGGAIQQYMAANNYPGLLDAATPIVSFSDVATTAMSVVDCHLLERVFNADTNTWDQVKRRAVSGMATANTCTDWDAEFYPNVQPDCPSWVPNAYNRETNPAGVRCDIQDGQRVIWGIDPATGYANLPLDNNGVQYGLAALQQGSISLDEFIALNRGVGGIDTDGAWQSSRSVMPEEDAAIAFASGQATGRGALDQIPIIDQTVPAIDYAPLLDIHDQVRPFEMRARLDATFGSHANQAIFQGAPYPSATIDAAEEWLTSLDAYQAEHPDAPRATAVAQSRPLLAADQCRVGVVGVPVACDQGVARQSSTRQVAGGPLAEDVIKCHLRDVNASDYPGATASQIDALRAIFPTGVCDYTRQSVGAQPRSQTWLSWSAGAPGITPEQIPYPVVRSPAGA